MPLCGDGRVRERLIQACKPSCLGRAGTAGLDSSSAQMQHRSGPPGSGRAVTPPHPSRTPPLHGEALARRHPSSSSCPAAHRAAARVAEQPSTWTATSLLVRTSTSSVVGGAALLHPPDVAQVGRGQDRDAVAPGDRGRCSVRRSSSERRAAVVLAKPQAPRRSAIVARRRPGATEEQSGHATRRCCSRPKAQATSSTVALAGSGSGRHLGRHTCIGTPAATPINPATTAGPPRRCSTLAPAGGPDRLRR